MEQQSSVDSHIDIVKRDIPNMWYRQIDLSDEPPSTTDSEEISTTDIPTTEEPTDTPTVDDTTTTSVTTSTSTSADLITTVSTTTVGSVTRTPRPYPNSGSKVNLTIFNPLFGAVAVLCLKVSSIYLNVN